MRGATLSKGSEMDTNTRRNRYTFGLGTIGRDMVYSLISMYLMFYLTDILRLSNTVLWWVTFIIVAARIFDALNDPVMGIIVDNTRTRFGKFKPWITLGTLLSGIFTVLLFSDFGLSGPAFIGVFAACYLMWGISFTANDIAYWSMLPALSFNQKERERIGAFARICANVGLFLVVGLIVPLTSALGKLLGSMQRAYFVFSLALVLLMWLSQSITVFGVREPPALGKASAGRTSIFSNTPTATKTCTRFLPLYWAFPRLRPWPCFPCSAGVSAEKPCTPVLRLW